MQEEIQQQLNDDEDQVVKRSPRRWRIWLWSIFIIVVAFAVFWWFYWQPRQHHTVIKSSIHLPFFSHKTINDNPIPLSNNNNQQIARLTSQINDLQQALTQLMHRTANSDNQWVLADAEYLTRLAIYNLQIDHNIPTAIMLLQTADQHIASLANPTLYPVRQALANAITELQAVPKVDMPGIIAQLAALMQQVTTLPQVTRSMPKAKSTSAQSQSAWQHAWHDLQSVIVVNKVKNGIAPLLTADQRASLNQHIIALLTQAQWAVLHRQQKIYLTSLQQVHQLISHYFVLNQQQTKSMLNIISQLQQKDIAPKMPNISALLQVFPKITFTKHNNSVHDYPAAIVKTVRWDKK